MMLTHPLEHRLVRYALGGTSEPVRRRIAEHLASCTDCRRIVQSTRDARTRVTEAPELTLPADFMAKVLADRANGRRALLPVEEPAPRRSLPSVRPAVWWVAAGGAVAVAGMAVVPGVVSRAARPDGAAVTAPRYSTRMISRGEEHYFPSAAPIEGRRLRPMKLIYASRTYSKGKLVEDDTSLIVTIDRDGDQWRIIPEFRWARGDRSKRNTPDTIWVDGSSLRPVRMTNVQEWGKHVIVLRARYVGDSAYPTITFPKDLPEQVRRQYNGLQTPYLMEHGTGMPYVGLDPAYLLMAIPLGDGWRGRFSKMLAPKSWGGDLSFEVRGSRKVLLSEGSADCWEVRSTSGTTLWFRKSDGILAGWAYENGYDPRPTSSYTQTVLLSAS